MNNVAYIANPPYLAQILQGLWPHIAPKTPLVAFDTAHQPSAIIILGASLADGHLPLNIPCLHVGVARVVAPLATWVAAPLNSASLLQHVKLWLASLADTPLQLKGGMVFNPRTRQFGQHILTEKEVATLQFLRTQPNFTATRAALQQHVWGYAHDADTHTVETHIYRLRQKIETNPSQPNYLTTTDDGYCLVV